MISMPRERIEIVHLYKAAMTQLYPELDSDQQTRADAVDSELQYCVSGQELVSMETLFNKTKFLEQTDRTTIDLMVTFLRGLFSY